MEIFLVLEKMIKTKIRDKIYRETEEKTTRTYEFRKKYKIVK